MAEIAIPYKEYVSGDVTEKDFFEAIKKEFDDEFKFDKSNVDLFQKMIIEFFESLLVYAASRKFSVTVTTNLFKLTKSILVELKKEPLTDIPGLIYSVINKHLKENPPKGDLKNTDYPKMISFINSSFIDHQALWKHAFNVKRQVVNRTVKLDIQAVGSAQSLVYAKPLMLGKTSSDMKYLTYPKSTSFTNLKSASKAALEMVRSQESVADSRPESIKRLCNIQLKKTKAEIEAELLSSVAEFERPFVDSKIDQFFKMLETKVAKKREFFDELTKES